MYKEKREINTRNTWDRNTNPAQIGLQEYTLQEDEN